jgi:hypothetical protein
LISIKFQRSIIICGGKVDQLSGLSEKYPKNIQKIAECCNIGDGGLNYGIAC